MKPVAGDVADDDAHSKPHCYDETVPVRNMDGTGEVRTTTRRVCVELAHSHWYRSIHMGAAMGLACGALGFAMGGPAGSLVLGTACGAAGGALGAAS